MSLTDTQASVAAPDPVPVAVPAGHWLVRLDARFRGHLRSRWLLWTMLVLLLAALLGLLVWLCRQPLAAVYSQQAEVVALASHLLGWLAVFHLGDAMQALGMFLLRCHKVTLAPLLVYALMLWGLGLGGGQWIAYHDTPWTPALQDPVAFWISSSLALALTSMIFLWLLRKVSQREPRG
jgi:MATE family multidrug resistance protein